MRSFGDMAMAEVDDSGSGKLFLKPDWEGTQWEQFASAFLPSERNISVYMGVSMDLSLLPENLAGPAKEILPTFFFLTCIFSQERKQLIKECIGHKNAATQSKNP